MRGELCGMSDKKDLEPSTNAPIKTKLEQEPNDPRGALDKSTVAIGRNRSDDHFFEEFIALISRGDTSAVVDSLHRKNISALRAKLVAQYAEIEMRTDVGNWKLVHEDLDRYTKAVQNYRSFQTSYHTFSRYSSGQEALKWLILRMTPQRGRRNTLALKLIRDDLAQLRARRAMLRTSDLNLNLEQLFLDDIKIDKLEDPRVFALVAFYTRLIMAIFGGLALVAPMLIMTLHPTRLTLLLTTSSFVFTVGVVLAWSMDTAEPKDIIGATAAYAAVLVIFVGSGWGF